MVTAKMAMSPNSSHSSARWHVLIFPGATEIAMELRESLAWCKEVELFSAANATSHHAPFVFASHFVVPSVEQPGWLPALQRVVRENAITHIFPAHDDALLALAEYAGALDAKVVTSPLATCRIARSKAVTLEHFAGVVPVPHRYRDSAEVTHWPVFVKPDRSQGAQGAERVESREALALKLAARDDLLALEYLPGDEYTIDCFSDRERGVLYASARQRVRIRAGIAMNATAVDDPVFLDHAHRIHAALPFHGAWFFQLKRDAGGLLKLLEVAPRIGGTSALSRVRGVNLPLLSLYEADRLPYRVVSADFTVEIDRALRNRYRHSIEYDTLYVDFDDTLIVRGRVNYDLVRLLYQALNRGVKLVLLTRHGGELDVMLRRYRLSTLFDDIVHLRAGEPKADAILNRRAIFIDDSFAERTAVHERTGIPVFAPAMIDVLFDDRE